MVVVVAAGVVLVLVVVASMVFRAEGELNEPELPAVDSSEHVPFQ